MLKCLWQFLEMALLPEYIEFPASGLSYRLEYGGDFENAKLHQSQRSVTAQDGAYKLCLLQNGEILRIFGPRRGTVLHVLLLQGFAKMLAKEILATKLFELNQELNFGLFGFRVGDQKRRWGSCSLRNKSKPKICLNWRALLLSPILLKQLCLHELCHIKEMNHSPAFHALLARYNPQEKQHERELGLAWKNMPPWAVHHSHFVPRRKRL